MSYILYIYSFTHTHSHARMHTYIQTHIEHNTIFLLYFTNEKKVFNVFKIFKIF